VDRRVPGDEDGLAPDRDLTRRSAAILGAATLLPLIALAVWARLEPPAAWELALVRALALGAGPVDGLWRAINSFGDLPAWIALVAVLTVGAAALRALWAAVLIALSLTSDLAAFALKLLVERARPESVATEHFFGPDSFAFPSGHVVRAVALAAVLGWLMAPPRARLPAAVAAGTVAGLVMGYARVSLGVHWPTDALGGMLLGLAWFALVVGLTTASGRSER
jgi:membrane-associated phospholipid phosphatase